MCSVRRNYISHMDSEQHWKIRGQQRTVYKLSGQNNKQTSDFSLYCFCNRSAIKSWRQNMLTLYVLGSDTERKIFCGFIFFPNQFWCMSQLQSEAFTIFAFCFKHEVTELFLWRTLVWRCVYSCLMQHTVPFGFVSWTVTAVFSELDWPTLPTCFPHI